jgi:PIN domain nuclease of toxin-antitoxin system
VIILDTHTWVWWVHGDGRLSSRQSRFIQENEAAGLGVSAISCWEIAMLVPRKRLDFGRPALAWFAWALAYPGIRLLELSPEVAVESTEFPGDFHADPADRMIVATARVWRSVLVTSDEKILSYPHVQLLPDHA